MISKINYKIETAAIKQNLIPRKVTKQQQALTYASEAHMHKAATFMGLPNLNKVNKTRFT